ncbi:hypothetical protein SAY87_012120 [Trapa incisa]|uniref:Uncharacterized protein n=2 Tax=Trapa TaxID=22665 RepID=A0AAN7M3U9_TRANT|nr:hypothetical protein SAY87_012120 [Trapa incisa]KAK4797382.1 hypothetical protein SAY86_029708 [Trapa natans]
MDAILKANKWTRSRLSPRLQKYHGECHQAHTLKSKGNARLARGGRGPSNGRGITREGQCSSRSRNPWNSWVPHHARNHILQGYQPRGYLPEATASDMTSSSDVSKPVVQLALTPKRKRRSLSERFLPSICTLVEVADSRAIGISVGQGYKALKSDVPARSLA